MTLIQREVQKVYMWKEPYTDYSAMQGPCDSGFHIPLHSEFVSMANIITALSITGHDIMRCLKMPATSNLKYTDGTYATNNTRFTQFLLADEFTSMPTNKGVYLLDDYGDVSLGLNMNLSNDSNGFPIRPFKDVAVTPDSSWTTLYAGTGDAGVYWNSTLGLISLSSDGTTWITIADKNLGATTVFEVGSNDSAINGGATISEANAGKFYQRGNNYGFPFTGATTTSSTQVNTSSYGPGNYYSSSTFIIRPSSPYNWQQTNNPDLRGGVTGAITLGGDIQIRPEEIPNYLCFTANTAGSTIKLAKNSSSITTPSFEISYNGKTRQDYTMSSSDGETITLNNVGDKVYWRNKYETESYFGNTQSYYHRFVITGSMAASGDVTYLIRKSGGVDIFTVSYALWRLFYNQTSLTSAPELPTTTLSSYCYYGMFMGCTGLTTAPALPATTLETYCCYQMFEGCKNLTSITKLPSTTLKQFCYYRMFYGCSKIKLLSTQTGEYQTPYRIPTTGTGSTSSNALTYMFTSTGGGFTGTPSINTTYYTSNTVV